MNPHISVVLNLHREGVYLPRTLRSLHEACAYAEADGLSVEIVAVLDRPDAATRYGLEQSSLSRSGRVKLVFADVGSLGAARNVGIAAASGVWIALCDGDDLISFNYLSGCYGRALQCGTRTVLMPQWHMAFGENYHFCSFVPLQTITPLAFLEIHPFGSRTFAHNSVYRAVPFEDVTRDGLYAYEDWHHNAELVAADHDIEIAPDVIVFYRQRLAGLMGASGASLRQIPPARLFEPDCYLRVCAPYVTTSEAAPDEPERDVSETSSVFDKPHVIALIEAAYQIDPAIDVARLRSSYRYVVERAFNRATALAYYKICERIGARVISDLVLAPSLRTIGERLAFRARIRELEPDAVIVVLDHESVGAMDLIAPGKKVIDLERIASGCDPDATVLLLFKMGQLVSGRIHVFLSGLALHLLRRYGRALQSKAIFYVSGEGSGAEDVPHELSGEPFIFLSEHTQWFERVAFDQHWTREAFRARIGPADHWCYVSHVAELKAAVIHKEEVLGDAVFWLTTSVERSATALDACADALQNEDGLILLDLSRAMLGTRASLLQSQSDMRRDLPPLPAATPRWLVLDVAPGDAELAQAIALSYPCEVVAQNLSVAQEIRSVAPSRFVEVVEGADALGRRVAELVGRESVGFGV